MARPFSLDSSFWQRRSDGLHQLTLRFRDPTTEREFLRHSTKNASDVLSWCGIVLFGTTLLRILVWLFGGHESRYHEGQPRDMAVLGGVLMALVLVLLAVGRMRLLLERIDRLTLEVAMAVLLLFVCTYFFLGYPPVLARFWGCEPPGCINDTSLMLNLFGTALVTNIFMPIRWCTLIPGQIYPLVLYASAQLLFPPECHELGGCAAFGPSKVWKVVHLSSLVVLLCLGKRKTEIQARELFIRIIDERTRRVQNEFQLDQLQQAGRVAPSRTGEPSLPDSVPTTTSTNRVFDLGAEGAALEPRLAAIAELGSREHWLIDAAELAWKRDQILGIGGFGIVVPGTYLGLSVAIKVPKYPPETVQNPSALVELCNELRILRRLSHPNVISFYGACVDGGFRDLALVVEVVEGASLIDFVNLRPREAEKARILHEISSAVCYLHSQTPKVVHGDLKGSNIHVQEKGAQVWGAAKLLDFGLARHTTKRARPLGGSIGWMAPEVTSRSSPRSPSDIFSMGRVIFFVATGTLPVRGRSRRTLVRQLRAGVPPPLAWPPMDAFSQSYRDVIERCSAGDPLLRPSASELRQELVEKRRGCPDPDELTHDRVGDLHSHLQLVRSDAAKQHRAATSSRRPGTGSTSPHHPAGRGVTLASLPEQAPTADAEAGDDDAGYEDATARDLLHPAYIATPIGTQAAALASALACCNFHVDRRACCTFHASAYNLRQVVEHLAAQPCQSLAERVTGQCPHCGVLVIQDEDEECNVCDICENPLPRNAVDEH